MLVRFEAIHILGYSFVNEKLHLLHTGSKTVPQQKKYSSRTTLLLSNTGCFHAVPLQLILSTAGVYSQHFNLLQIATQPCHDGLSYRELGFKIIVNS